MENGGVVQKLFPHLHDGFLEDFGGARPTPRVHFALEPKLDVVAEDASPAGELVVLVIDSLSRHFIEGPIVPAKHRQQEQWLVVGPSNEVLKMF